MRRKRNIHQIMWMLMLMLMLTRIILNKSCSQRQRLQGGRGTSIVDVDNNIVEVDNNS